MNFVFQKHYVASNGRGFVIGAELPDGVLSKEQIDHLVADGFLSQVFNVQTFIESEFAVAADELEVELSEVEQLDPEKTVRKKRR